MECRGHRALVPNIARRPSTARSTAYADGAGGWTLVGIVRGPGGLLAVYLQLRHVLRPPLAEVLDRSHACLVAAALLLEVPLSLLCGLQVPVHTDDGLPQPLDLLPGFLLRGQLPAPRVGIHRCPTRRGRGLRVVDVPEDVSLGSQLLLHDLAGADADLVVGPLEHFLELLVAAAAAGVQHVAAAAAPVQQL